MAAWLVWCGVGVGVGGKVVVVVVLCVLCVCARAGLIRWGQGMLYSACGCEGGLALEDFSPSSFPFFFSFQ